MARAQVALSLANMAALLQAQGKAAAAEEHMRRALSIREDALGPDHPLVRHAMPKGQEGSLSITVAIAEARTWSTELDITL